MEPLSGSGERLCAGIVARGADGSVYYHQALSPKTLKCLYAGLWNRYNQLIQETLSHAAKTAQNGINIAETLYSGMHLSPPRPALADNMLGVVRQALQLTASSTTLPNSLDAEMEGDEDDVALQDGWKRKVKTLVLNSRPLLREAFEVEYRFEDTGIIEKLDFHTHKCTALFANIRAGRSVKRGFNGARGRLWLLQLMAEVKARSSNTHQAMLVLGRSSYEHDPNVSAEAFKRMMALIDALKTEARSHHGIRIMDTDQAELAAIELNEAA